MLIIRCRPELCNLCMMMIWPLCRLCNIAYKVSELKEEDPVETGVEAGADNGVDVAGAERAVVEVEGAKAGAGKDEATAAEAGAGKDEAGVDEAAVEVEGAGVGRP